MCASELSRSGDGVPFSRARIHAPRARAAVAADDPSKVPPPPPRKSTSEMLSELARRNWKLLSAVSVLFVLALVLKCVLPPPKLRHGADASFDDDDTSSANFGSRSYGNVPLSQQQKQRDVAMAAAGSGSGSGGSPSRTFGNVPLSQQQKQHAE